MQNNIFIRIITTTLIVCFIWQDIVPSYAETLHRDSMLSASSNLSKLMAEFQDVYLRRTGTVRMHKQLSPENIVGIIIAACADNVYESYGGRTFLEYLLLLLKLACRDSVQKYKDFLRQLLAVYPLLREIAEREIASEVKQGGGNAKTRKKPEDLERDPLIRQYLRPDYEMRRITQPAEYRARIAGIRTGISGSLVFDFETGDNLFSGEIALLGVGVSNIEEAAKKIEGGTLIIPREVMGEMAQGYQSGRTGISIICKDGTIYVPNQAMFHGFTSRRPFASFDEKKEFYGLRVHGYAWRFITDPDSDLEDIFKQTNLVKWLNLLPLYTDGYSHDNAPYSKHYAQNRPEPENWFNRSSDDPWIITYTGHFHSGFITIRPDMENPIYKEFEQEINRRENIGIINPQESATHKVIRIVVPDEIVERQNVDEYQEYMVLKWLEVLDVVKQIVARHYGELVRRRIKMRSKIPQVGKHAQVTEIEGDSFKVRDSKGNIHTLSLKPYNIPYYLSYTDGVADEYKPVINAILKELQAGQLPRICSFSSYIEDLFGFVSAEHGIIAINRLFEGDRILLFHETAEYLAKTGKLKLELSGSNLSIKIGSSKYKVKLDKAPSAIANKNPTSAHYLLRALQRQVYGEIDKYFTQSVKNQHFENELLSILRNMSSQENDAAGQVLYDLYSEKIMSRHAGRFRTPSQFVYDLIRVSKGSEEKTQIVIQVIEKLFNSDHFNEGIRTDIVHAFRIADLDASIEAVSIALAKLFASPKASNPHKKTIIDAFTFAVYDKNINAVKSVEGILEQIKDYFAVITGEAEKRSVVMLLIHAICNGSQKSAQAIEGIYNSKGIGKEVKEHIITQVSRNIDLELGGALFTDILERLFNSQGSTIEDRRHTIKMLEEAVKAGSAKALLLLEKSFDSLCASHEDKILIINSLSNRYIQNAPLVLSRIFIKDKRYREDVIRVMSSSFFISIYKESDTGILNTGLLNSIAGVGPKPYVFAFESIMPQIREDYLVADRQYKTSIFQALCLAVSAGSLKSAQTLLELVDFQEAEEQTRIEIVDALMKGIEHNKSLISILEDKIVQITKDYDSLFSMPRTYQTAIQTAVRCNSKKTADYLVDLVNSSRIGDGGKESIIGYYLIESRVAVESLTELFLSPNVTEPLKAAILFALRGSLFSEEKLKIEMIEKIIPELESYFYSMFDPHNHPKTGVFDSARLMAIVIQHTGSLDLLSPELRQAIVEVANGRMNSENKTHVLANYIDLNRKQGKGREISFNEFYMILDSKSIEHDLMEKMKEEQVLNLRGLVYEAYMLREKILELKKKADELGRKFVVVGNLSYGGVALSPITEERNGETFIIGTDIPVWYTKVGSTQCHNNEFYLVNNLFTNEQLKFLAEENPFVTVIDASTSVSDPERTSPHIPDGFKGYRNFFMVLSYALFGAVNPEDYYEDNDFVKGLMETQEAKALIKTIQGMVDVPKAASGYKFRFWYKRDASPKKEEYLYLRVNKVKDTPAQKGEIEKLDSPVCIFMQSAIHPEDVDRKAKDEFIKGEYTPAFYDDKNHFQEFHLDYEEGYGVVLSKRFVYQSRKLFREFMRVMGETVQGYIATQGKVRQIETIVLDLDGTVVKTDAEIDSATAGLINDLMKRGKRVVIITEDIEANLERRLAKLTKCPNLVIFTDGGSLGWSYDRTGDKFYFDEYNRRSLINDGLRDRIVGIIKQGTYQLDDRPSRVSKGYRLDLRYVKDRNTFIDNIQRQLQKEGIKAKVYKAGKTSVKIVLQHKEHALRFIAGEFKLDRSKILVMADSAHSRDIDRGMLTALREAVSVNVGGFSPTISRENPNIVQHDNGGIGTTISFLGQISDTGSLPEGWIVPSLNGQPSTEGEEEERGPAAPNTARFVTYNASPAQIGKRAGAEEIIYGANERPIAFKVNGREVLLAEERIDLTAKMEELGQVAGENAELLEIIIDYLKQNAPVVYEYAETKKDLFGFAVVQKNFIALYKNFIDEPVALFHEVGHYLIDTGKMELRIMDDELQIKVNGQELMIKLNSEALAIANKDINNPHYLLRALQRQIFGENDINLTIKIKAKGFNNTKVIPAEEFNATRISLDRALRHMLDGWFGKKVFKIPLYASDHKILLALACFSSTLLILGGLILLPIISNVISTILICYSLIMYTLISIKLLIIPHYAEVKDTDIVQANRKRYTKSPGASVIDEKILKVIHEFEHDTGWNIVFTDHPYLLIQPEKDKKRVVVNIGFITKNDKQENRRLKLLSHYLNIIGDAIPDSRGMPVTLEGVLGKVFGKDREGLDTKALAEKLIKDLSSTEAFNGLDNGKRAEVRARVKTILDSLNKGEKISENELKPLILSLRNIMLKDKFELVARIAEFVNSTYPKNIDKAVIVALIEEQILEVITGEEPSKETDLITEMKNRGAMRGVAPGEIDDIFGLFRNGVDILTMDPALDPGQIDGSYFNLCEQIGKLLGVGQGAVLKAISKQKLNGRKFKVSGGKIIEGTKLYRSAKRLEAYNNIHSDVKNILKAVPADVEQNIKDAVVVFSLEQFREMPLVGLKTVLSNIRGSNVKLGLRIPEGMSRDKVSEFISQDWELNGDVILLPEDIRGASEELKTMNYENVSFVADSGEEMPSGAKVFGVEDGSSFYAVFLFGLMYACTDKADGLMDFLEDLDIDDPDEIIEMMNNREYFKVNLIRTKEILEEFKNKRIYLDIAA